MREYDIMTEEQLKKLEPLVADLKHEIVNPMSVIDGFLDIAREDSEGMFGELDDERLEELEDFLDTGKYVVEHTELMGTVPEDETNRMIEYMDDSPLEGKPYSYIERIAKVSNDVLNYQRKLVNDERTGEISLESLLEPLENSVQQLGADSDFDYAGLEEEEVAADSGLRMLFWTLGKNWESHSYGSLDDVDFNLEVSEAEDSYLVDVWDTGKGLFDEVSGQDGKSVERRYRTAYELINAEEKGGRGLSMASNIAEVYDAEMFYSEEMLDGEGFGVRVKIPKYQSSTSESA